ncbi:MAG: hypothetical protein ACLR2K_04670 [Paraclostridium sordellii]
MICLNDLNRDDKGMTEVIEVIAECISIYLPNSEIFRTTIRINLYAMSLIYFVIKIKNLMRRIL